MRKLVSLSSVALLMLWFAAVGEIRAQNISLSPEIQKQEVPVEFGNDSEKELTLTIKSAKDKWSFIRFGEIPEKTFIKVKADVPPYFKDDEIAANRWYAVKDDFGLVLKVDVAAGQQTESQSKRQLSLSYQFGKPNGAGNELLKNAGINDVMQYVETENTRNLGNIVAQEPRLLGLEWKVVVVNANGTKRFSRLLLFAVPLGAAILAVVVMLLVYRLLFQKKADQDGVPKQKSRQSSPPRDGTGLDDLGLNQEKQLRVSPQKAALVDALQDLKDASEKPKDDAPKVPVETGAATNPPSPAYVPKEKPPEVDGDLETLRSEVFQLQTLVNSLSRKEDVEGLKLQQATSINDLRQSINTVFEELTKAIADLSQKQKESEELIQRRIVDNEQRFHMELDDCKKTLNAWDHRNGLYEGMVGLVLGESVEALRKENFNSLMLEVGENLNRLIREEIPSNDGLKELGQEATQVSAAFQTAFQKMCALSPQVESKLRPYVDQANQVASELNQFSSQLKCRQLNFNVRVSAHSGARDSFLAELGTAIKRELDKLQDPQTFWTHELERLATSHVIAAVDIYDKEVARRSSDGEVEKSLSALFAQTRLSSITPQPGEPFRPADQNLMQMVEGPAGSSQKIARVVSRGFIYNCKDGRPRLIRKASVEIYR
jgi:hypothetical protein